MTNTGILNLNKRLNKNIKKGYRYEYKYIQNHNKRTLSSVNLEKLINEIIKQKLPYEIVDEELYEQTLKQEQEDNKKYDIPSFKKQKNNTGIKYVIKIKCDACNKKYRYLYSYHGIRMSGILLEDLKTKILSQRLPYEIVDEELYEQTLKQEQEDNKKYHPRKPTNTGVQHLSKTKTKKTKKQYKYVYIYINDEGIKKTINSVNIHEVHDKIIKKGLPWNIINKELYEQTLKQEQEDNSSISKRIFQTNTGIQYMSKHKNKQYKKGYNFVYKYTDENNKKRTLTSINLKQLKEKVLSKNMEWNVINQELYNKILNEEGI